MSPQNRHQPLLILLSSHWISMLGTALVTLAGFSWVFVLPLNLRGHVDNPYIGLLVFVAIPAVFLLGLILIPIGIALSRRLNAELAAIPDRASAWKRAGLFFGVMTIVNLAVASQGTYRAVEHMDTVQFCGQSCHVMKPEFTAHLSPPHQQVECATCHTAPGASGWFAGKVAGTGRLLAVVLNNYPRPLESALESNRLVSSRETCEQCHTRGRPIGSRLRVLSSYKDDEANTRTQTVLMMQVDVIHRAHLGSGVGIRYAAQDKKRQTIPWVEYKNASTGVTRIYLANDAKAESIPALATFEMQCVDCHNRPAHTFETPDRAVDNAISAGRIPQDLPFVKKTALALLKAEYASDEDAARKIPAGLTSRDRQRYPQLGANLLAIYQRNVFPDLKVTWGTYPNNLGHSDYPGCFRCHDDSHSTADKKTIPQDCDTCHKPLAMDEPSPAVLRTLGLAP